MTAEVVDNATSSGTSVRLTSPVDALTGTLQVSGPASALLQQGQFRVLAFDAATGNTELMMVQGGAATTSWSVMRGIEGTLPLPFGTDTVIKHVITAGTLKALGYNITGRASGPMTDAEVASFAMDIWPNANLSSLVQLSAFDITNVGRFIGWPDGGFSPIVYPVSQPADEYITTYRERVDTSATDRPSSTTDPSVGWVPATSTSFVPLTDEAAAVLVTRTPEIRAQHLDTGSVAGTGIARNFYIPSDAELAAAQADWAAGPSVASDTQEVYFPYVTGGIGKYIFEPTTDEIVQWASHKWGIPTNRIRAQAHLETKWNMDFLGDPTGIGGNTPDWYPQYVAYSRAPYGATVYQSLGIMQVRWTPELFLHPGTEPLRWKSTPFNVDYYASVIRFYLDDPGGFRTNWGDSTYIPHDYAFAASGWFQPYPWRNFFQGQYQSGIEARLAYEPWRQSDFANLADVVRQVHQPLITRDGGGGVLFRPRAVVETYSPPGPPSVPPPNISLMNGNSIIGQSTVDIPSGTPITTVTISPATRSVDAGFPIYLNTGTNHLQVIVSSNLTQGDTVVHVTSVTPTVHYPVGTRAEITLSFLWWTPIPGLDPRAPIQAWHIVEAEDWPVGGWLTEGFGHDPGFTFTGNPVGTPIRFAIMAQNDYGYSEWSGPSNYVTPTVGLPDQVGGLLVTSDLLTGNIGVSWDAQAVPPVNAVTEYVVVPVDSTYTSLTPIHTGSTDLTHVVSGLTLDSTYTFQVAAVNSVGQGPLSYPSLPITSRQTTPPCPPQVGPQHLRFYAGDDEAVLFWQAIPTIYNGGVAISGYNVYEPDEFFSHASDTSTEYHFTGMGTNHETRFEVTARNSLGEGPLSLPSNRATTKAGLPNRPANAFGGVPGGAPAGNVELGWVAPSPAPASPITDYIIIPVIDGVEQTPVDTGSAALSYTVTGMTSGTAYTFRIRPVNAIGPGLPSFDVGPLTPN